MWCLTRFLLYDNLLKKYYPPSLEYWRAVSTIHRVNCWNVRGGMPSFNHLHGVFNHKLYGPFRALSLYAETNLSQGFLLKEKINKFDVIESWDIFNPVLVKFWSYIISNGLFCPQLIAAIYGQNQPSDLHQSHVFHVLYYDGLANWCTRPC